MIDPQTEYDQLEQRVAKAEALLAPAIASIRTLLEHGPTAEGPLFRDPWPVLNCAIALGALIEVEIFCWNASGMPDATEVAEPLLDAITTWVGSIRGDAA